MKSRFMPFATAVFLMAILTTFPQSLQSKENKDDPWKQLKQAFPGEEKKTDDAGESDPWAELRRVFLPFTSTEEEEAVKDKKKAASFSRKLIKPLKPYIELINECSGKFKVPEEIIGAVIMVESGGNPSAAAGTSSAKGLMQTIRSTFRDARTSLEEQGIEIADNPFNPRSSIYAGTWYLSHVFDRAEKDSPSRDISRSEIEDWCTPVKYYYAGPTWGAQKKEVIITYIDGKRIVVDKKIYCEKVMRYARMLKGVVG